MGSNQGNRNLDDYDTILTKGYPGRAQLHKFPLGDLLLRLDLRAWTKTARAIELQEDEPEIQRSELEERLKSSGRLLKEEQLGEVYRCHIKATMEAINLLTSQRRREFCPNANWSKSPLKDIEASLWLETVGKDPGAQFLRFVTLYHDIGKVIHRDRHPALGRHILESLSEEDTRLFNLRLGEERFSTMVQLVGHHDLFGVLCTGEASRPVLIDAAGLRVGEIGSAVRAIGYLCTLNLADMYGTLGKVIPSKLHMVVSDWKYLVDLLLPPKVEQRIVFRSELEDTVHRVAQQPESAAERIRRLLVAAILMIDKDIFEKDKQYIADKITNPLILSALTKRLGPELTVFCSDFALVCKLDYSLRFIVTLVSEWFSYELERTPGVPKDVRVGGLADIVIELLVRLVTNYRDLTRHREGWKRRIGLELMGLNRAEEITKKVIELLLSDRRAEGVNWAADEATAWYFI